MSFIERSHCIYTLDTGLQKQTHSLAALWTCIRPFVCHTCFLKHCFLLTRPLGVGDHQAWANDVEGSINVHGIGITKG